jgi:hypothetical protein
VNATAPPLELGAIEKPREEELEETRSIAPAPGDPVLLLTDGITDACNTDGERASGRRDGKRFVKHKRNALPAELLGEIFSTVENFACGRAQHDDMAAALFHYERDGAAKGTSLLRGVTTAQKEFRFGLTLHSSSSNNDTYALFRNVRI